jgi:predicted TIM-barrel fold metal-dependent hydrolase
MSSTIPFAVDSHLHAHWPQKYPYSGNTGSRVDVSNLAASAESLFPTLLASGVTHALIIHPGAYGTDNRATLDAIAASNGRAKGIAGMKMDAGEEEFVDLKSKGIVGVRVSLIHTDSETFSRPEVDMFLARCRKHDFFVEVFAAARTWPQIIPKLVDSGVKLIVEHTGYPIISEGISQPGFQAVLQLGRSTNTVIKVGAGFRLSQGGEPYDDVRPFALKIVEAFGPDRCIWGSDWPFLNPQNGSVTRPFPWKLEYEHEFSALARWLPDQATREAILWKTPARLFGFHEIQA